MKRNDQRDVPLVNGTQTADIFATELANVERIGPCVRFILACEQGAPDGSTERIIVCKVVVPLDAVAPAIRKTLSALVLRGFTGGFGGD